MNKEPLESEKNEYIPQKIKDSRRSTSISQRQQVFGDLPSIEDQVDHHVITEESEVIIEEIRDAKNESFSVRQMHSYSRRSLSCQRDSVNVNSIDTDKKLEFNLLKGIQIFTSCLNR